MNKLISITYTNTCHFGETTLLSWEIIGFSFRQHTFKSSGRRRTQIHQISKYSITFERLKKRVERKNIKK